MYITLELNNETIEFFVYFEYVPPEYDGNYLASSEEWRINKLERGSEDASWMIDYFEEEIIEAIKCQYEIMSEDCS